MGQGKWYPGEPLPRWALRCYWRLDGQPIWRDESLFADPTKPGSHTVDDARRFGQLLAEKLGVESAARDRRLRRRALLRLERTSAADERRRFAIRSWRTPKNATRLARIFEQGITSPVGCALPLRRTSGGDAAAVGKRRVGRALATRCSSCRAIRRWASGCRSSRCCGTSGRRSKRSATPAMRLPIGRRCRSITSSASVSANKRPACCGNTSRQPSDARGSAQANRSTAISPTRRIYRHERPHAQNGAGTNGSGRATHDGTDGPAERQLTTPSNGDPANVVRTALCIEPRGGVLHIFMPPLDRLEDYLELIAAIEATAAELADAGRHRRLRAAARSAASTT